MSRVSDAVVGKTSSFGISQLLEVKRHSLQHLVRTERGAYCIVNCAFNSLLERGVGMILKSDRPVKEMAFNLSYRSITPSLGHLKHAQVGSYGMKRLCVMLILISAVARGQTSRVP